MNALPVETGFRGRRVLKNGVWRFIPDQPEPPNTCEVCGQVTVAKRCRPCRDATIRPDVVMHPRDWTMRTIRRHHAAYIRGKRDDRTIAGHREWMRRYKAQRRAQARTGALSATDRRWCERAAVAASWVAAERNDRAAYDEREVAA